MHFIYFITFSLGAPVAHPVEYHHLFPMISCLHTVLSSSCFILQYVEWMSSLKRSVAHDREGTSNCSLLLNAAQVGLPQGVEYLRRTCGLCWINYRHSSTPTFMRHSSFWICGLLKITVLLIRGTIPASVLSCWLLRCDFTASCFVLFFDTIPERQKKNLIYFNCDVFHF